MSLLDKLERKIGAWAVPNLTIFLIAGQTVFYVMFMTGRVDRSVTLLSAGLALQGEWWRLGLVISLVNLAIWLGIGPVWWKLVGIW